MYCSSCGTESTPGLNYCNRCGAGLNAEAVMKQKAPYDNVTNSVLILGSAVALISLVGFGILIKGATTLANSSFAHDQVMFMIFMGMFTILAVDMMLVWQLSRLIKGSQHQGHSAHAGERTAPREVKTSKQTHRELNAQPEPIPSVTENTTRAFEHVYRESSR